MDARRAGTPPLGGGGPVHDSPARRRGLRGRPHPPISARGASHLRTGLLAGAVIGRSGVSCSCRGRPSRASRHRGRPARAAAACATAFRAEPATSLPVGTELAAPPRLARRKARQNRAAHAEFERDLIAARRGGVKLGRKSSLTPDQVKPARRRVEGGEGLSSIAATLRVGRTTLYRALKGGSLILGRRVVSPLITILTCPRPAAHARHPGQSR